MPPGKPAAGLQRHGNRLLAALPSAEYRHLLALLEGVTLNRGEVLYEAGLAIPYLYFPVEAVVSLLASAEGPEIEPVGFEGAVGISLALGSDISSSRALVQASGRALRITAAHFRKVFAQCPALQRALYRYAAATLAQARQTIACNLHSFPTRRSSDLDRKSVV